MLSKVERLTSKECDIVLKEGSSASSELFSLRFKSGFTETKCSVAVSKKVSKSAVERNRVRRRVYALLDELLPTLPQGTYSLISVRPVFKEASPEKIKGDIEELFKKAAQRI